MRDALDVAAHLQVLVLQGVLVGLMVHGILIDRTSLVFNAGLSLSATFLPFVIWNLGRVALSGWQRAWIANAFFLHAFGIHFGLYRPEYGFDHLSHAAGASVVAAIAYVYYADRYDSRRLGRRGEWLAVGFTLLFVLVMGALWEVAEYGVVQLRTINPEWALIGQGGLQNTILDLWFDLVGAIVVLVLRRPLLDGARRAYSNRWTTSSESTATDPVESSSDPTVGSSLPR